MFTDKASVVFIVTLVRHRAIIDLETLAEDQTTTSENIASVSDIIHQLNHITQEQSSLNAMAQDPSNTRSHVALLRDVHLP